MIDTHTHIDAEEFRDDLAETIKRAAERGVDRLFLPAIDFASSQRILSISRKYPGVCYPMLGLHPEEVDKHWSEYLHEIRILERKSDVNVIAIGEIGLDFYWSREYEGEQLDAFEQQVIWAIERQKPIMIHCRKAQNEMVKILRRYEHHLVGGVFHCFTGNEHEALELLQFDRFVLGIGGVLTFKKSLLPTTLPSVVPLERIVLETDAPYMAPVPHRGQRNEPMYVVDVAQRLAEAYNTSVEEVDRVTTNTAERLFLSR